MPDVIFEDFTIQVKAELNDRLIRALETAAATIERSAKRNTRVGRGGGSGTKGKWKHFVDPAALAAYIGNTEENAIWEEFGTGEYALNDGRQTPWYVSVEGYTGKKRPTFNGKVVIVYGKNGVAFYKTNGKKPSRALYKAFEAKKKTVEKIFHDELGGMK